MRLAKYLAHSGVASRRAAEKLIANGRVSVGGAVVTDPARDVDESSDVRVDGGPVAPEPREVYALNKPAGVMSTARDPGGNPTVVSLVPSGRRLYPVGRLDADSTGLILLTNDGELANLLMHPRYGVQKTYRAEVRPSPVSESSLRRLREGVELEDGPTAPARVRRLAPARFEITIGEGRNRQVRRMVEAVGHRVTRLERVAFGPLRLEGLEPGAHRRLTPAEVERLRKFSGPMKLRALRGATTVEHNDADAILDGTEELVREVMERNSLHPDDMVSCIFTCTSDLNAEFPAVAARRLGLSSVPLLCACEIDRPGALPRVIRLLLHCYADPEREVRHVYLHEARSLRRDPGGGAMTIEYGERIRRIPVYPAAQTYEFGGTLVKLASNETPFPPHPQVLEAVERELRTLNRYPDPDKTGLRRALADRYELAPSQVAVGNGSCELLLSAAEALLEPGAEIVYAWPSFSIYPHLAAASGARAITVPLDEDGCHDLDAMAREVTHATRMVLVCNPNNPTATALPIDAIDEFVGSLPRHVAVLLDEAYVEFTTLQDPDDSLPLLKKHPNLVLLRTFSKVYGLCGLRVGYSLAGGDDFRHAVDIVRQPFSVNALALAAATEALKHQDEVATRVERTAIERLHIEEELGERGLETSDSEANFSWVSLGDRDETAVMQGLAERGVIVRGGAALGSEGHMRVTYGTRSENDRFLAAMDEVLASAD